MNNTIYWPYATSTDPLDHRRHLEPGETRRRLARAKYEEDITMQLHIHEPVIKAKNSRLLEEALLAEQLRLARNDRRGPLASAALSARRALGHLLIAAGERLQPASPESGRTRRPKTAMQA